jgi:hypothetical protein
MYIFTCYVRIMFFHKKLTYRPDCVNKKKLVLNKAFMRDVYLFTPTIKNLGFLQNCTNAHKFGMYIQFFLVELFYS